MARTSYGQGGCNERERNNASPAAVTRPLRARSASLSLCLMVFMKISDENNVWCLINPPVFFFRNVNLRMNDHSIVKEKKK